jgi:hypothetical protein
MLERVIPGRSALSRPPFLIRAVSIHFFSARTALKARKLKVKKKEVE